MTNHSDAYEQLVIELYVRDFKASCAFYQAFGFRMVRDEGDFAEPRVNAASITQTTRLG